MRKKSAFTLIELLVVIAIIGILATISILALSNARAKSRDAKRAGDMKQVQTALELFFNDNNRYPTADEWNTGKIYSTSTNSTSTYMQVIPAAPTPNDGSCTVNQNTISYQQTEEGGSYAISFCLGGTTGSLASGPKCLTPGGVVDVDCTNGGNQILPCSASTVGGTICSYAGEDYPTATIGSQVWMTRNLNVGTRVDNSNSSPCIDINPPNEWWSCQNDISPIEKYCYDNDDYYCGLRGGLYEWSEALGLPYYCNYTAYTCSGATCTSADYNDCNYPNPAVTKRQGICPSGWHIPNITEFQVLAQNADPGCDFSLDNCSTAGDKLKATAWNGTNDYGFAALPTGFSSFDGSFGGYSDHIRSYLCSSLPSDSDPALFWYGGLYANNPAFYGHGDQLRGLGVSVRCVRN